MLVLSLTWEEALEKGMATYSSILAWRTPCTEEPGGLQSVGPQSLTRLKQFSTCAQRQINTSHKTELRKILKLCPRICLVGPMCFNTNHCNTVLIEAVLEGG